MPAPIRPRDLKSHLRGGGKAVNGWCSIPSTVTAEIVARQGFDTVSIDLQHGLVDYQAALAMLQAIDGLGVPTLCRVP
jgi:4-hydroxy-2-oxoheptanedioate aldolase